MDGAGSLADKVIREQNIASEIIVLLNKKYKHYSDDDIALIMQALQYAKCDLLSQSVGEFPESLKISLQIHRVRLADIR